MKDGGKLILSKIGLLERLRQSVKNTNVARMDALHTSSRIDAFGAPRTLGTWPSRRAGRSKIKRMLGRSKS